MSNPFIQIYEYGGWNARGSGHGSQPRYTAQYQLFLEAFLRYNRISSVLDYGCGDWSFSKQVNWQQANYHGVDCVPRVIEQNKALYERENVRFSVVDFAEPPQFDCELLIVKDVLQHWSSEKIKLFLPLTKSIPFVLLINDFRWTPNVEIRDGGYRGLDLTKEPYFERGSVVFSFGHMPDEKVVFFQDNSRLLPAKSASRGDI